MQLWTLFFCFLLFKVYNSRQRTRCDRLTPAKLQIFHFIGTTWSFSKLIWQFYNCLIRKISNKYMKVYPIESSTTNRRKLYAEARKYDTFRISFSRSSFLYNLTINLIIKGNVQLIFLCNPQKSSVNAFLMRNIKGTLMQIWKSTNIFVLIWRRFRIIALFSFWDIRTRDIWNACLQTYRNNRIC